MANETENRSAGQTDEYLPPNERSNVTETILDIPKTIVDEDDGPLLFVANELVFDASTATATEGRMAKCATARTFIIHTHEVLGAGSQGTVVRASDAEGRSYAAKITFANPSARDRRNRKAVLDYLVSLIDDHPLGELHFKQTHLMPVYAYGSISDGQATVQNSTGLETTAISTSSASASTQVYDIAIMALCENSLDVPGGYDFAFLRDTIIPQAATGLRNLHVEGIVHRDIKPKNLYFLQGAIVLGDYGISSLLDAGRDTGATVLDKRTPGYSPHSSVIQRENDWYALGYTIWTLYNDGIHPHQALIDAGDLSAVLAGKHPVEFIPHHPEEATLGELIYGLTLESVRGRLGYDDVQAWLEDPAHFHFEDPFDRAESGVSYQFKGKTYTDNALLADAMASSWQDAADHVYSQTLERYLTNAGQHDLAVSLHRVTASDEYASGSGRDRDLGLSIALTLLKGSATQFCWCGHWYAHEKAADQLFARISETPAKFYATCADADAESEAYRFLLAAFAGEGEQARFETLVRAAYNNARAHKAADVFLKVDKLLVLFELICEDPLPVRMFFLQSGPFGDAVWIKQHVADYRPHSEDAKRACRALKSCTLPDPTSETIEEMRPTLKEIDSAASSLASMLSENSYMQLLGLDADAPFTVSNFEAYRIAYVYGQRVTIGFASSLVPAAEREDLCNFDQLRGAAVAQAKREASSIEEKAESYQKTDTVAGNSKGWHVMLMVGIVLAYLFGTSLLTELSEVCLDGFAAYGPKLAAVGGWGFIHIPVLLGEPTNSCAIALGLLSIAFFLCAVAVFLIRMCELIPVAFSSIRKKRALANAARIRHQAEKLEGLSLAASIGKLMRGEALNLQAEGTAARGLLVRPKFSLEHMESILTWVYRVSFIVLMLAVAGATAPWLPMIIFEGTINGIAADSGVPIGLVCQAALMFSYAIYYGIVFKFFGFKPNMIAVMVVTALLPLVCFIAGV